MKKNIAKRFFYPIGQGAFYAEKHPNFQIVYDCGCSGNKNANNVIHQNYDENDEIDYLFISHFDIDHVSKIPELKSRVSKIKNVILPLLHEDEIIIFQIFKQFIDKLTYQIAIDPESFFEPQTRIIRVSLYNEDEITQESMSILDLNSEEIITSGQKLKFYDDYNWIFIPFNIDYKNRRAEVVNLLNSINIDIEEIRSNNVKITDLLKVKRAQLRKIFNSKLVGGSVNNNSLVLLSSKSSENEKFSYFSYNHACIKYPYESGCIYTGDVDLNLIDLKKIFKHYFDTVSVLQIPHHGSYKNFDIKPFRYKNFVCPISFGTTNLYGHPSYSKVIAEIIEHNSLPFFVTEKLDSGLVQVIEI